MMEKMTEQKVIVGLGNPDEAYRDTYHNAGRRALEVLRGESATTGERDDWQRHKDLFEYIATGSAVTAEPVAIYSKRSLCLCQSSRSPVVALSPRNTSSARRPALWYVSRYASSGLPSPTMTFCSVIFSII